MFGTDKCPFCQKKVNPTINGWAEHKECGEKPEPNKFRGFDGLAPEPETEHNEHGHPVSDIYLCWPSVGC